jgi:hypothetical protein
MLNNINLLEIMNRISLFRQEGALKSYFPQSKITRNRDIELTWIGVLNPSPLSPSYTIKIHYRKNEGAKIYVIDPKPLMLAENKSVLPHVYSTHDQRLCLYYPKENEWDVGMFYVNTLIPWASEWLIHYEIWVCTGVWHGGGIHDETTAEKASNSEKEIIEIENERESEVL